MDGERTRKVIGSIGSTLVTLIIGIAGLMSKEDAIKWIIFATAVDLVIIAILWSKQMRGTVAIVIIIFVATIILYQKGIPEMIASLISDKSSQTGTLQINIEQPALTYGENENAGYLTSSITKDNIQTVQYVIEEEEQVIITDYEIKDVF